MTHNDAMRSVASLLHASDATIIEILHLGGGDADPAAIASYLARDDEEGCAPCPHEVMAHFLNGLVIYKRGQEEGQPPAPIETAVTNNVILKKVRVAFALRDADVAAIFARAGLHVSKSERAGFFRHRDDRHYRECGDPVLRTFLSGLTR